MKIKQWTIRLAMCLTLCAAAAGAGGCATDASVISNANEMHTALAPAVMTDPALDQYIQAVGDRIIGVAHELDRQGYGPSEHRDQDSQWMYSNQMRFHFVNSQTLNAFTTGGNHMYIYTELFRQCKSEDELAAVMAHEYGHVYGRHVQKGMNRQYGILAASLAAAGLGYAAGGDKSGEEYAMYFAGAAQLVGGFVGMGYTRKDEAEADELGFVFYVRAGWDPAKFGDFFQQMIDKGYDTTPELLSDHPPLADRVQTAKERASMLGPNARNWRRPNVATPQQFADLQQRAQQIGQTMPSDQTLEQAQELLQALPRSCLTPVEQKDQVRARQRVLEESQQIIDRRRQEESE